MNTRLPNLCNRSSGQTNSLHLANAQSRMLKRSEIMMAKDVEGLGSFC
jgi:hypothetical protein